VQGSSLATVSKDSPSGEKVHAVKSAGKGTADIAGTVTTSKLLVTCRHVTGRSKGDLSGFQRGLLLKSSVLDHVAAGLQSGMPASIEMMT
jgi:hypothetical protein